MTINTERLKTDAAYWDEVAPDDASHWCMLYKKWIYSPNWYDVCCIPRPQATADDWVDGLPPLGVECEVMLESGKWDWCQVKAHSGSGSWIATKTDNRVIRNDLVRWRPIPTPEQRQREEIHACISDAVSSSAGNEKRSIIADTVDAILSKYNLEPKT